LKNKGVGASAGTPATRCASTATTSASPRPGWTTPAMTGGMAGNIGPPLPPMCGGTAGSRRTSRSSCNSFDRRGLAEGRKGLPLLPRKTSRWPRSTAPTSWQSRCGSPPSGEGERLLGGREGRCRSVQIRPPTFSVIVFQVVLKFDFFFQLYLLSRQIGNFDIFCISTGARTVPGRFLRDA
jgi:hypothetical protein